MKQTQIEWGNSNRPSRVPTLNLWGNGDGGDGDDVDDISSELLITLKDDHEDDKADDLWKKKTHKHHYFNPPPATPSLYTQYRRMTSWL